MSTTNVTAETIKAAANAVKSEFYLADDAVEMMTASLAMNMQNPLSGNLIFYGPGGYGKTEMTELFLTVATGKKPFVVNMNQSSTPQEIFGGYDLEKFANGDGIQYLMENSFMQHEYVVFEEGLEPRPRVLSALKYLITSRVFAPPGQIPTPIKTKCIFIVTNVDTAVFNEAEDTAAFLERFPIRHRVSWDRYSSTDRMNAINNIINKFDPKNVIPSAQRRIISAHAFQSKISPRMIGRIVQSILAMTSLNGDSRSSDSTFRRASTIFGFNTQNMADASTEIADTMAKEKAENMRKGLDGMIKTMRSSIEQYKAIRDHLDDPRYIIKLSGALLDQVGIIKQINNVSVNFRLDPEYGKYGDELASWSLAEMAKLEDEIGEVQMISWNGMLNTVNKLVQLCEQHGIDPDVTNIKLEFEEQ